MPFESKYEDKDVTYSRLYHIWNGMKQRCTNEKGRDYRNYGGRGICVCDNWVTDFRTFETWAKSNGYSDDLTIDRIDVNGNYEPSNCRWADAKEQANNRRSNRYIEFDGKTKTISEWSDCTGLKKDIIIDRLSYGWSVEDTLTTLPNATKKKVVTYKDKEYSLRELSDTFGIPYGCVKYRHRIGMSIDEIVETPVNHGNKLNKK